MTDFCLCAHQKEQLDAKQSLTVARSAVPLAELLIVNWSVNWFACVVEHSTTCCGPSLRHRSAALALLVVRTPPSSELHKNPVLRIGLGFGPQSW